MKTLHIDFPIWIGDNLYYIEDSTIKETYVYKVIYKLNECMRECENYLSIEYITHKGKTITEKDLGVKYFIDKKELIQKLISQL